MLLGKFSSESRDEGNKDDTMPSPATPIRAALPTLEAPPEPANRRQISERGRPFVRTPSRFAFQSTRRTGVFCDQKKQNPNFRVAQGGWTRAAYGPGEHISGPPKESGEESSDQREGTSRDSIRVSKPTSRTTLTSAVRQILGMAIYDDDRALFPKVPHTNISNTAIGVGRKCSILRQASWRRGSSGFAGGLASIARKASAKAAAVAPLSQVVVEVKAGPLPGPPSTADGKREVPATVVAATVAAVTAARTAAPLGPRFSVATADLSDVRNRALPPVKTTR
jgi:hypothetical protein